MSEVKRLRDAALAELAALKGGQGAVAMIRDARQVPGFENEMPHVVSCNDMPDGLYPVYLAPPAQASAWVPVSERLPDIAQEVIVHAQFDGVCAGVLDSYGEWFAPSSDYKLTRVNSWMPLPAAPTPGASDGKGVQHERLGS